MARVALTATLILFGAGCTTSVSSNRDDGGEVHTDVAADAATPEPDARGHADAATDAAPSGQDADPLPDAVVDAGADSGAEVDAGLVVIPGPNSRSTFYIGHSLMSDVPDIVRAAAREAGLENTFRAQNIPGAPLRYNWNQPRRAEFDYEPQYEGVYNIHLPERTFDTLVMVDSVPRGPGLMEETKDFAIRFIDYATSEGGVTDFFLFEPWHCIDSGTPDGCDWDEDSPTRTLPWRERIDADAQMWRDLVDDINAERPNANLRLVPVATALGRISDAIDAGEVPGMTSIRELFGDPIHPTSAGKYLVGLTHYAVLYHRSPEGMPVDFVNRWGRAYDLPSEDAALVMQRVIWETVLDTPRSGVTE
jgi:hypothetical protein